MLVFMWAPMPTYFFVYIGSLKNGYCKFISVSQTPDSYVSCAPNRYVCDTGAQPKHGSEPTTPKLPHSVEHFEIFAQTKATLPSPHVQVPNQGHLSYLKPRRQMARRLFNK